MLLHDFSSNREVESLCTIVSVYSRGVSKNSHREFTVVACFRSELRSRRYVKIRMDTDTYDKLNQASRSISDRHVHPDS